MKKTLKPLINSQLKKFVSKSLKSSRISKFAPIIGKNIKEFVCRDGKRIRPIFFLVSYQAFSKTKKLPANIIKTSLAFELLHDFLLIHDDIIDNSNKRRGKPTIHKLLQNQLRLDASNSKNLSIVVGDIVYAMALEAFIHSNDNKKVFNRALSEFLCSTIRTGTGEFIDVINGLSSIKKINQKQIYLNYYLKTSEYTFIAPLLCGAILAGANNSEISKLRLLGKNLGEAFQINDDLIGIFSSSRKIGKSVLSDIIESKKTLPIHFAYKSASKKDKAFINKCMGNSKLKFNDLKKIRNIIVKTNALSKTKNVLYSHIKKANLYLSKLNLSKKDKEFIRTLMFSFIEK